MRRIIKTLLILIPLAILVHDAVTGRMSVFRDQYTREEVRLRLIDAVYDRKTSEVALWLGKHGGLKRGDDFGATLLGVAVVRGATDVAELLLEEGVDVNAVSGRGWSLPGWAQHVRHRMPKPYVYSLRPHMVSPVGGMTPLHWAAALGRTEVAGFLIQRGASINAGGGQGRTPLLFAVINGRDGVVDLLLRNGADPNIQNAAKYTALMLAVLRRQQEIAEFLLAKGADLSITNHTGGTALHVAVEVSQGKMAQLLLKHGAKVNAKDNRGRTPLDHAKDERIRVLLQQHGGKPGKDTEGEVDADSRR